MLHWRVVQLNNILFSIFIMVMILLYRGYYVAMVAKFLGMTTNRGFAKRRPCRSVPSHLYSVMRRNRLIGLFEYSPVHEWTKEQNGKPCFSSIVRQCKWPSLSKKIREPKWCFALFQTSSLLFHFIQFVKSWRIFLELNSKGLYLS